MNRRELPQLIKTTYEKAELTSYLTVKVYTRYPNMRKAQMFALTTPVQHCIEGSTHRNYAGEKNEKHPDGKEKCKTISIL